MREQPPGRRRGIPIGPWRLTPGGVVFVAVYAAIVFWFKDVDLYHKGFSTAGLQVAAYNACRVLFIFYLFWIIYQCGNVLSAWIAGDCWKATGGIDRIVIGFFAGTGVCHAVLLLLGYLDLYTVPVAIVLTLPLVAFAYRDAVASFSAIRLAIAEWREHRNTQAWLFGLAVALALASAVALLLVKGLYPAGGHDYFLHYFNYYKAVIDRGDIWPNQFWYHGYDSKGDGLVFLSMLLTDPLAPQLVTFCFISAGVFALYQLLNRIAPGTLVPLVGVILYLSLYIYTPGLGGYRDNGGWGDFEKWHELESPSIIAIIWLVTSAFDAAAGFRFLRMIAAGSTVIAAVIIDYTIAIYIGLLFTLLSGFYFVLRWWRDAWCCFVLAATAGVTLAVMLATNDMATGLFGDIGILAWWRFTDIEKLYRSGALLQAINDYWAYAGLQSQAVPLLSVATFKHIFLSLHLELLGPVAIGGAVAACVALGMRRGSRPPRHQTIALAAAAIAWLIVALVFGRDSVQMISFFRYSSFMVPIVIAIGVVCWSVASALGAEVIEPVGRASVPLAVLAGCWIAAIAAYPAGHFWPIVGNATRFALGRLSIDAAYSHQSQWPVPLPSGAIDPGARGAYAVTGPHVRVWSFHSNIYCMLPDCDFEVFYTAAMTPEDDLVFFGAPDEARRVLQQAGLNYFLFSSESWLIDPVVAAPLFAPDSIAKYLGLRWTDGTTTLLTWLGPDTTPLSQNWLATYCHVVATAVAGQGFYYGAMRKVFADLRARPHPWRGLDLPWAGDRPIESINEPDVPPIKCPS